MQKLKRKFPHEEALRLCHYIGNTGHTVTSPLVTKPSIPCYFISRVTDSTVLHVEALNCVDVDITQINIGSIAYSNKWLSLMHIINVKLGTDKSQPSQKQKRGNRLEGYHNYENQEVKKPILLDFHCKHRSRK